MRYSTLALGAMSLYMTGVSAQLSSTDECTAPINKGDSVWAQRGSGDIQITSWPFSCPGWGKAIVNNKCGSVVYAWNVGQDSDPSHYVTIAAGGSYSWPLAWQGKSSDLAAGPSIKISPQVSQGSVPNPFTDPIVQFEYTINGHPVPGAQYLTSFDISNVDSRDGPPFAMGGLLAHSPQDPKVHKFCAPGLVNCDQSYMQWNDDTQAMTATADTNDIVLDLCGPNPGQTVGVGGTGTTGPAPGFNSGGSSGGSSGGNSGNSQQSSQQPSSQAPPPPPSSSAAPPPPSSAPAPAPSSKAVKAVEKIEVNNNSPPAQSPSPATNVVVVTEYAAPAVVTVWAPAPKEKRDEHVHEHLRAHQKINKRRHGA